MERPEHDSVLVHQGNREPLAETARRINRTPDAARRLCPRGKLAHQRDACGRYWSSPAAAAVFNGGTKGADRERRGMTDRQRFEEAVR